MLCDVIFYREKKNYKSLLEITFSAQNHLFVHSFIRSFMTLVSASWVPGYGWDMPSVAENKQSWSLPSWSWPHSTSKQSSPWHLLRQDPASLLTLGRDPVHIPPGRVQNTHQTEWPLDLWVHLQGELDGVAVLEAGCRRTPRHRAMAGRAAEDSEMEWESRVRTFTVFTPEASQF